MIKCLKIRHCRQVKKKKNYGSCQCGALILRSSDPQAKLLTTALYNVHSGGLF